LGCINIHASLLPRWRGAAPIQRAIEAGDTRTGITIMQMDCGLDTGPILLVRELPIARDESAGSVHDRLAVLGAQAIVEALAAIEAGAIEAVPQPEAGVSYARKIGKADTILDWREPAARLADRVRALDPAPGAIVRLAGSTEAIKLWRARALDATGAEPGVVRSADAGSVVVGCGDGSLALLELQRPGGRRLAIAEFLRGHPIARGARFETVQ
ncbi:MAG: methionyl-tRNA formyltransferase, partial [Burkholderiaceae bacterium]|nr:methionyl-tRNA formyltransferase [Burkholderiaceae bacterium]